MDKYLISLVFRVAFYFLGVYVAFVSIPKFDGMYLWLVIVTLFASGITFLVGDLIILQIKKLNYWEKVSASTAANLVLGLLVAYLISLITDLFTISLNGMVVYGLFILLTEVILHTIIARKKPRSRKY